MKTPQLKRELRFWDSIAISVGIVIGVGIFRTPAQIAHFLHSPSVILLAWLTGAAISLLGVFCYAELSSKFPQTGGTYIFLKEAYGKFMGFLYGWAEFSINRAATIAAVAYIFATYLRNLIPFNEASEKMVALIAIALFTWLNCVGLRTGVKVQNFLSGFKLFAILLIAGLIFIFSNPLPEAEASGFFNFTSMDFKHFAPALVPILWSYGGWHESTFMSGEFRDTKRELPLSLIMSALLIAGIYVFVNAAYLRALSPVEMEHTPAVAAYALEAIFGRVGSFMITIAILVSASGALNSNILTGARVPFAVGQDIKGMSWLGQVDPKFRTPMRALILNSVWASVLVLWGNFEQILFLNAFEIWLFFILVGGSVFILRKKFPSKSSFLIMGYPVIPILFITVSGWLCGVTIQSAPKAALFGILIILVGIPIYFITGRAAQFLR